MNNHEFGALLKESLKNATPPTDVAHFEKTQAACADALVYRASRQRIGFGRFLLLQVRFIGWRIWLIQGAILACMLASLLLPVMNHLTLGELTKAICALSLLTGTIVWPLFYLSFYYRMHEIEAATRFSSARLFAAKGFIIMAGNIVLLAGSFFCASITTDLTSLVIVIALSLPFLLSVSGTLYCWTHFHVTTALYGGLIWNALLFVLIISPPQLYERFSEHPILCAGIGLFSFFFCMVQGLRLKRHPRFADTHSPLI